MNVWLEKDYSRSVLKKSSSIRNWLWSLEQSSIRSSEPFIEDPSLKPPLLFARPSYRCQRQNIVRSSEPSWSLEWTAHRTLVTQANLILCSSYSSNWKQQAVRSSEPSWSLERTRDRTPFARPKLFARLSHQLKLEFSKTEAWSLEWTSWLLKRTWGQK